MCLNLSLPSRTDPQSPHRHSSPSLLTISLPSATPLPEYQTPSSDLNTTPIQFFAHLIVNHPSTTQYKFYTNSNAKKSNLKMKPNYLIVLQLSILLWHKLIQVSSFQWCNQILKTRSGAMQLSVASKQWRTQLHVPNGSDVGCVHILWFGVLCPNQLFFVLTCDINVVDG